MVIQSSGSISLSDIAGEFEGTPPHSISEYYGRVLGIPISGALEFSRFYGKSGRALYGGRGHGVAVTPQGIVAFGGNNYGQLGTKIVDDPIADSISIQNNGSLNGKTVAHVACGNYHTIVLATDATLHSFGSNRYGQLGTTTNSGTTNVNTVPINITNNGSLSGKTIVSVDANGDFTIVLTSDGSLHGFGRNYDGNLGITTNNGNNNPNPTPAVMTNKGSLTGKSISSFGCGAFHTVVLASDGTLHSFGENRYGQLGTTTNSGTYNPNPTPIQISLSITASSLAVGSYHTIVSGGGEIYTFGYNFYGQLGTTTNVNSINPNPTPINITNTGSLNGKTVASVAAEGSHTIVLATDNSLHSFGYGSNGQLGTGSTTSSSTPQNITNNGSLNGKTIATVACGYFGTLVVATDGTFHSFGETGYLSTTPINITSDIQAPLNDGLVAKLDSSNSYSWPGSGTTWYDVSGNNLHGTWNSVTTGTTGNYGITPYFSTNGGTNYCTGGPSNAYNITSTSGFTIFIVYRATASSGNYAMFFNGSSGREISVHLPWSDGTIYFDQGGCCAADQRTSWTIDPSSTVYNTWHTVALVRTSGSTNSRHIYYDGGLKVTNSTNGAALNFNSSPMYYVNQTNNWPADVMAVHIYNTGISSDTVSRLHSIYATTYKN